MSSPYTTAGWHAIGRTAYAICLCGDRKKPNTPGTNAAYVAAGCCLTEAEFGTERNSLATASVRQRTCNF